MQDWSAETSWDTVCRRAAGCAPWNAVRRLLALLRRGEVVRLMLQFLPYYSPLQQGLQARIAGMLGVSEATISRDVKALHRLAGRRKTCPTCGLAKLPPEFWEHLDAEIGGAEAEEDDAPEGEAPECDLRAGLPEV